MSVMFVGTIIALVVLVTALGGSRLSQLHNFHCCDAKVGLH